MASVLPRKKSNYKLKDLKTLGQQLHSSRAHINNLPILLSFISPSSTPQLALESLFSLQPFFLALLSDLPPSSSKPLVVDADDTFKDPELVYKVWLRSKFDEFVKSLIALAVSSQSDEALRDIALDAIMEFVKRGKDGKFQSAIYHRFLHSIVHSTMAIDMLLDSLVTKFFKYIDVRYFTYISLEKYAKSLESTHINENDNVSGDDNGHISKSSVELSIRKIQYILSHIPPFEVHDGESDNEMWSELGLSSKDGERSNVSHGRGPQSKVKKSDTDVMSPSRIAKKMKLKFTKAWLSFLRLPLPLDVYKEVLVTLHQAVIPHLSNPIMLCDFLTRSYDIGGVISVMALSSLFILMTQHGLEYPNFYEKLYLLLVPSIFMAKHRAKFFQLLDSCLRSPLLPAYLAAAFTKKLSRMALVVPPSGALVIIALIHNLLRRHPSINCLVHWQTDEENDVDASRGDNEFSDSVKETATGPDMSNRKRGIDPFNAEESNPAKSNAMRSSLWEIDTLRDHYCPAVSRFVASLENDLTVRSKTTEVAVKDFSSGSYGTIFGNEIRRRVKQVPLAFYKSIPASLFSESDFTGWSFKLDETSQEQSANDENGHVILGEDQKSVKRQRIECP